MPLHRLPTKPFHRPGAASAARGRSPGLKAMTPLQTKALIVVYLTVNLVLIKAAPFQNETISTTAVDSDPFSEGAGGGLVFTNPTLTKSTNDPEKTQEIVQKARNNEYSAEMITNRTKAFVSCENGEILVKLNFTEPFRGVGYAKSERTSPCSFFGTGGQYYEMRLPLKGCGTKQEAPRLFINNIILRFHRSLELEEDEEKTIVCRYPPPEAPAPPPPPGLPARVINAPPEPAKLTQYEPFVVIAALLFFALLLAGVGTTSYVTKKQVIKPINTPLPLSLKTEHEDFIDNISYITTQDIKTQQKLVPLPKLSTQIVEDVFMTNIHETETVEDLVHRRQTLPKPRVEQHRFDDVYLTNQDEITEEEILQQRQLALNRNLEHQRCDDTYITNEDEIVDEENLTSHRLVAAPSKIELRTIEDTFITNVDEVVEREDTTYLKDREESSQEQLQYSYGDESQLQRQQKYLERSSYQEDH